MKLPSFQFYPGDWMKDPDLRRCSLAAKGLWIEMLCVMFESKTRGVLDWSDEEICNAFGNATVTRDSLLELTQKGVASRNEDGKLFCRRMMRDDSARVQNRDRQSKFRESRKANTESNGEVTPPVTPPSHPSSSSSSTSVRGEDVAPAFAEIPTADEVVKFGAGPANIPAEYCRTYHAKTSEKHQWITPQNRLIDWMAQIRRYWIKDCRTWKPSETQATAPPKDPARWAEFLASLTPKTPYVEFRYGKSFLKDDYAEWVKTPGAGQ